MYNLLLLTLVLFSFFLTFILVKAFIPLLFKNNLFCIDQQKKGKPKVSNAGGIPTFLGFFITIIVFIFVSMFVFNQHAFQYTLILSSIFLGTLVGIIDDTRINLTLKKSIYGNKQHKVGLSQFVKPVLTLFAYVPIMFIVLNHTFLEFPVFGYVHLGLFYPFLLAPLIFVVVTNSPNLLAGTNGLEGGIMFLLTLTLGVFFFLNNNLSLAIFAFVASASALAFLCFNWCPAKVLPGDSLTYFSGVTFASLLLVGRAEFIAGFIYIPLFIELILKLKGKMRVRSFGDLQKNNTIKKPYKRIFSWTHVFMHYPKKIIDKKFTEKQITISILLLQLLFCVLGLILFV